MTKREKLNYIMETYGKDETVKEFVDHEIELLDNKAKSNEKRKEKKAKEFAEIEDKIMTVFSDEDFGIGITVTEIESELNYEYTKQKLTPRVNALVEKGKLVRGTYKRTPVFSAPKN